MELADMAIVAGMGAFIFLWDGAGSVPKQKAPPWHFYKFYRLNGVDRLHAREMQKELARRGRSDIPTFNEAEDAASTMARLQQAVIDTPYMPRDQAVGYDDANLRTEGPQMWMRTPDPDDG